MSIDQFKNGNKRILVTGGAGFIGGALIRNLLKNTNSIIFNIDKLGYASDLNSIENVLKETESNNINNKKSRYQTIKLDLTNKEKLLEAFKYSDPDHIFHLAAESHVDRSINSPELFIESNIKGTFNLLEAARSHYELLPSTRKIGFKFQHISTDEVYGTLGDTGHFSENSNYDPRSPYSASKASSDHLVNAWHHTYGLPTLITNCSNNFGPWQFPEKLIPVVILKALAGKEIPLYGDGKNIRDWLYVEDHVKALILIASKGLIGSKYCIGGTKDNTPQYKNINNRDIAELICYKIDEIQPQKKPHSNLIRYVDDRPGHDFRYSIDSSKIQNELNWHPQYSIKDSINSTVIWYTENLHWCEKVMKTASYHGERLGTKK